MKQSIQLRLGQHLTMTPQLQQAIRLLQLSSMELQVEIQQALDSNLMLETGDEHGDEPGDAEVSESAHEENTEADIGLQDKDIPDDLPVDSSWEDIYEPNYTAPVSSEAPDRDFDYQGVTTESLAEHLIWQMQLSNFSATDESIAEAIIDAISDDGYLTSSLEDILQGLQAEDPEIELDEVEAVLHRIQNFDPPGIAARDLQESLHIQLRQLPEDTEWRTEALKVIDNHFDLLAKRDFSQLIRKTRLSEETLGQVIQLIQSLNPRPGGHISDSSPEYIIPDVIVRKIKGKWRVELNPESAPKLRINQQYAGLIQRGDTSADNTYLKNHLQEARWFLKSLQSRNETLLKVATNIIERQQEFLEHGEEAMKPLVLHDIAEAVEMHESTISRVTTKKYMLTPRGVFELKYFFSSHVKTSSGGEASSTAIQAHIKKLVANEDPKKPLSDSKIADILSDQGINVARRTVAKYREALNIPPSNERKRLA